MSDVEFCHYSRRNGLADCFVVRVVVIVGFSSSLPYAVYQQPTLYIHRYMTFGEQPECIRNVGLKVI